MKNNIFDPTFNRPIIGLVERFKNPDQQIMNYFYHNFNCRMSRYSTEDFCGNKTPGSLTVYIPFKNERDAHIFQP